MTSAVRRNKGKGRAQEEEKVVAALPLGKQLAHTDKAVRDRAIRGLVAFVSRGGGGEMTKTGEDIILEEIPQAESSTYVRLEEAEMAKLWKGLYYCFWMSDKPLVQQGLARDLSSLLLSIQPNLPSTLSAEEQSAQRLSAALDFLKGFWEAIVREWEGLDRLRMDKFYLLIRRFVGASFGLLAREEWTKVGVERMTDILVGAKGQGPLNYTNPKIPMSLPTHLSDLYLTELDLALAESPTPAPLIPLLSPFIALLANTPTPVVYRRLIDTLFAPLLAALQTGSAETDADALPKKRKRADEVYPHILMNSTTTFGGKKASVDELRSALLQALFMEAAKEGSRESNRRKIYQLWREEGGDDE